jgi:capsular polysaccharide biosynthesis protein
MEVNEVATRLLRRYWLVLLAAITVPVVGMGMFVVRQPAMYTAHARIIAGTTMPRAQAEAAAVASQVQAIATSLDVVAHALSDAHLGRDAETVIKTVVVTGLGSSALVDLAYTDRDPTMAQRVTAALVTAVTEQLDAVRIGGLPDVIKHIDDQLTELATKQAPIAVQAQANPKDPVIQNTLAGINRLISDLAADRNRLSELYAAAGHASVVATPAKPKQSEPRGLPAKLGIAAVLGLAIGLVLIGINETMRPAVSGASRVGRLLEVPMLGTIGSDPAALSDIGRRLRLAARRAAVSTVVLVRANRSSLAPELVDRIEAAALRPDAAPSRVSVPIDTGDTQVLTAAATRVHVSVLTVADTADRLGRLGRVCAIDELDPSAEGERIGLVVLAGGSTRLTAIEGVRDLMTAAGWPLLGVLGDSGRRGGRR